MNARNADSSKNTLKEDNGETLAKLLGPAYSKEELMKLLDISSDEVDAKLKAKELFAVTVEEQHFFPLFQFNGDTPNENVLRVIRALSSGGDPWTIVLWLSASRYTQNEDNKDSKLKQLQNNPTKKFVDEMVQYARQDSARWRD